MSIHSVKQLIYILESEEKRKNNEWEWLLPAAIITGGGVGYIGLYYGGKALFNKVKDYLQEKGIESSDFISKNIDYLKDRGLSLIKFNEDKIKIGQAIDKLETSNIPEDKKVEIIAQLQGLFSKLNDSSTNRDEILDKIKDVLYI